MRACPTGNGKGACALRCASVSNTRLWAGTPLDPGTRCRQGAIFSVVQHLPGEFAGADVEKQAALIEKTIDVKDLQDPEKVGKLLERFTIMWEMQNPSTTYDPLAVFGSSSGYGISADLLISINSLKLGGK